MKARLIQIDEVMQILLCTGRILNVDARGALAFLKTYNDPSHYEGTSKWNNEIVTMDKYDGLTIATVTDQGILVVENADLFRFILETGIPRLLTANEYAARYKRDETRVRRLCREGRLAGAVQKGTVWIIPEDAPFPEDERRREGRRWGNKQ